MKPINSISLSLLMGLAFMTLVGCQKPEGAAEHAGKEIDKAVEKADQKIDKAVEKTGQKIEQAGDRLQNAAQGEKK